MIQDSHKLATRSKTEGPGPNKARFSVLFRRVLGACAECVAAKMPQAGFRTGACGVSG
jgi:hypothetical protein